MSSPKYKPGDIVRYDVIYSPTPGVPFRLIQIMEILSIEKLASNDNIIYKAKPLAEFYGKDYNKPRLEENRDLNENLIRDIDPFELSLLIEKGFI